MLGLQIAAMAQQEKWDNFRFVDSLIANQIYNGQFTDLIKSSENAMAAGTKYPKLYTYRGYAFLKINQPVLASQNYLKALRLNSTNRDAILGWYYSNLEMNQSEKSNFFGNPADSTTKNKGGKTILLNGLALDLSLKFPQDPNRKPSQYFGASINTKIFNRLYLTQQVAMFNQNITLSEATYATDRQGRIIYPLVYVDVNKNIKQYQYYAKLNYHVLPNLQFYTAYHGLNLNISETMLKSKAMIFGLNTQLKNFHQGLSFVSGKLYGNPIQQFHLQSTWYPFHNLSLYATAGISSVNDNGNRNYLPDFTLGWQLNSKIWMETSAIYGNYRNALFAEGSIWFNTLDKGTLRSGLSAIFKLNPHLNLNCTYNLEKFENQSTNQNNTYFQHSLSTGLIWKP